jgi:hypothetical protein
MQEIAEIRDEVKEQWDAIRSAFIYYSMLGNATGVLLVICGEVKVFLQIPTVVYANHCDAH